MKYNNIVKGTFIKRPNRFIAIADINGNEEVCHVKNTGRCKELLTEGAEIFLEKSDNPNRKTGFDLVAVKKNGFIINMDSYAPNIAFGEFLKKKALFSEYEIIKSEYKYKNSRFDFYISDKNQNESFLEVKGVTLENNGVVMFPDAPTSRGLKHINELIEAKKNGFGAYIVFVVQMENAKHFTPNKETDPKFFSALKKAKKSGVEILSYTCSVSPDEMKIKAPLEVIL